MKGRHFNIVTECYVDTSLVQIVAALNGVNHQSTCSQVASTIQKTFKDEFALGIIDSDKRQPSYTTECEVIAISAELTLVKHLESAHYFIKVNHVMEKCILNAAREINYDLAANGFPSTLEGMMRLTKHKSSLDNPQLKKLFHSLRPSPTMTILHKTIAYLSHHPYDASREELRKIFSERMATDE
jgi:hypothetical protein